jgi:hypothetical protein
MCCSVLQFSVALQCLARCNSVATALQRDVSARFNAGATRCTAGAATCCGASVLQHELQRSATPLQLHIGCNTLQRVAHRSAAQPGGCRHRAADGHDDRTRHDARARVRLRRRAGAAMAVARGSPAARGTWQSSGPWRCNVVVQHDTKRARCHVATATWPECMRKRRGAAVAAVQANHLKFVFLPPPPSAEVSTQCRLHAPSRVSLRLSRIGALCCNSAAARCRVCAFARSQGEAEEARSGMSTRRSVSTAGARTRRSALPTVRVDNELRYGASSAARMVGSARASVYASTRPKMHAADAVPVQAAVPAVHVAVAADRAPTRRGQHTCWLRPTHRGQHTAANTPRPTHRGQHTAASARRQTHGGKRTAANAPGRCAAPALHGCPGPSQSRARTRACVRTRARRRGASRTL